MPTKTGIEFLQNNSIKSNVIFTTAYSEYAVESYNFNVVDYLLKPIQENRFDNTIEKLIKNIDTTQKAEAFIKIESKKMGLFY